MFGVNETTKVILVPKGIENLEIFRIKLGDSQKSLAVSEGHVYELREIGPSSDYDSRGEPRLPSGEPVRSLILESTEETQNGAVVSNPNLVSLSGFDMVYPFLNWVSSRLDTYMTRFHTSEDLMDAFCDGIECPQLNQKLEANLQSCIDRTCESVEENDERFFKVSVSKVNSLLAEKINRLKNLLLVNPDYVLSKKIKETLGDLSDEIPHAVLEQQLSMYCIDFVFGSFLCENLKRGYLETYGGQNKELKDFLEIQRSKQESLSIAEQNLASIAGKTRNEADNNKVKSGKPTKPARKQSVKVAKGKGALDHFFKKNT
ncbi:hypothetical protein JCM33374_g3458 [Metschnikowia sp. JCM 33374]|nr:hypothetical protein JCM33374_g3458 [Metschnikowia sp. JCM 33374]